MTTDTRSSTTATAVKIRENRLRATAERRGLKLHKSPRKDRKALDYNRWMVRDLVTGRIVAGEGPLGRPSMSLDDVERWLES